MIGVCIKYFHENYGGMLQAYATVSMLEARGLDYELIQYEKKRTPIGVIKSLPRLLNGVLLNDKYEAYIVKKAARKLLKNAVPRLEKVLNDDYVERDRSTYKGQLADIDKAIDADLEEIEHIKATCLNSKTMNASEIARQKQTILDLRKKLRKNKREYKSISTKLDHLENYWEELEPDFELRAKALQWLQSLPQGRTRTRKFLLGATDMYFKALFLDITIHSKSKYTIHWFDDVYTKVILRNTGGNITHA